MGRHPRTVDRRNAIKGALAAGLTAISVSPAPGQGRSKLIKQENRKEGALDWQLSRIRLDRREGYRSPWIEGYCSRQSVSAGESIDIMVSTDPPESFQIEIFRMGYYAGRGARLMTTLGPFKGKRQPTPNPGKKRVRECRWEPTTRLKVPAHWPSGVYLGRLTLLTRSEKSAPWQSYVIFIVRDDRPADILFQCSDNTWQAYNRWPARDSLYDDGGPRDWFSGPGVDVSFDRPYGKYRQIYENPQSVGSGEFLCWEFPLAYWLEWQGYDVSYCSNSDLIDPARGLKCKTFISVGHDEYWDLLQYHSVKKMIDAGVNALFLSGNSICWLSPFQQSSDGRPNRIITRAGPYDGFARRGKLRDGPFPVKGPDEGLIMGGRNVVPVNGGGDWIVTKPEHWIFGKTGMKKGDRIPGMVGWEYHGDPAPLPGLEIVAEGTALAGGTTPQHWTATIHPGPKDNFVFNAATIYWPQCLSSPPGHMLPWSHWTRPHGPDQRVCQMTHNLLEKAIG